jgi:hypothetical protein
MSLTADAQRTPTGTTAAGPSVPAVRYEPSLWIDAAVVIAFMAGAVLVTAGLWSDPAGQVIANNSADQYFFEWVLTYTTHALTHGANPFFTPMMNAPLGVNLAANTAITVLGVLLTPITLVFGSAVTFVLTLTLSLSMTAYAWYWVLHHRVRVSRGAAIVAGAFCGFAPGMMSHANAHLNFTAQFVLPILLWRLVRLTRTVPRTRRDALRDGAVLGLLAAVQYSIGAELLFFTGFAAGVYALAWSLPRRRVAARIARRVAGRLAVGAGVAVTILAYPIWMQFLGPQSYHGTGFADTGPAENLYAFGWLRPGTLGGDLWHWPRLAINAAEENTYFGPVLPALVVACVYGLCRIAPRSLGGRTLGQAGARALAITAFVIAVLSLGPRLRIGVRHTDIPLPWALLHHVPIFSSALPGRLALLLTPIIGVVLAIGYDEFAPSRSDAATRRAGHRRWIAVVVGVAALLPIVPLPLTTGARSALPRFFTSGEFRRYLPVGRTVVSLPASTSVTPDAQRWQTATGFAFPIDGGYFLGPGADGRSHVGPVPTPTYELFKTVAATGETPIVTDSDRARARADLAYWRAGLIVLPDPRPGIGDGYAHGYDALRRMAIALFGPARHVDDVLLWTPSTLGGVAHVTTAGP